MSVYSHRASLYVTVLVAAAALTASPASSQPRGGGPALAIARVLNVDQYHAHVRQLQQRVAGCQSVMDENHCDPSLAGPDDLVVVEGCQRPVQYDWLREALRDAGKSGKDAAAISEAKTELAAADQRLTQELVTPTSSDAELSVIPRAAVELRAVLASSEFSNLSEPSPWYRLLQRIFAWLGRRMHVITGRGMSPALLQSIVYGGILSCVTVLAWWYLRQIRQQRLAPGNSGRTHEPAVPAVDWQVRLQQAKEFADKREWRQAVHHVYWATISRLEASGNLPANGARTPREYLRLISADEKRKDLLILTRSFEHIWYGRRNAEQKDFEQACFLLERLAAR